MLFYKDCWDLNRIRNLVGIEDIPEVMYNDIYNLIPKATRDSYGTTPEEIVMNFIDKYPDILRR